MAKKMNLLLTISLAVICLIALLCAALLPITIARAADDYVYEKQSGVGIAGNVDSQILLVASASNGKTYAINATGSFALSLTEVTVVDNKITTPVTDSMLWTVGKNGNYFTYRNVSYNNYLSASGPSMSGNYTATDCSYYSGNELMSTTYDMYVNLNGTSLSSTTNYDYSIPWSAYKKTLALENPTQITFDKGSTEATGTMADVFVEQGSEYTLPSCSFTRSKYLFNGWSVNGEIKQVGDKITVSEDITITATWAENWWTVTLQMEGQEDYVLTVQKGSSQSLYTNENWWSGSTPDGKMFSCWQLDGEAVSSSYKPTEDVTLVAVFVDAYTVSFDWNGGTAPTSTYTTFKTTTVTENAEFSLRTHEYTASYMPTKTSCILAGWENVETGEKYLADLTNQCQQTVKVVITQNTTFKAIWKFDGKTIYFTVDGEPYATAEIPSSVSNSTYVYFSSYGVTNPTKDGYEFKGWLKEGSSSPISSMSMSSIVDGMTLEASFVKQYYIHFRYDGETEDYAISIKTTSTSIGLSSDSYKGTAPDTKAFSHWIANVADSKGTTQFNSGDYYYLDKTYDGDIILTPVYVDGVKVTFDFAGGGQPAEGNHYYDTVYKAPGESFYVYRSNIVANEGYAFVGWLWKDAPEGQEGPYATSGSQKVTIGSVDVVFVAQWTYDGVTLIFSNGTDETIVRIPSSQTSYTIALDNPEKDGYRFKGWSADEGETVYKKGDAISGAALVDSTFVAQFEEIEYKTVTLHYGEQIETLTIEKGKSVSAGTNKNLFDEKFGWNDNLWWIGWYNDSEFTSKADNFVTVNDDLDLYAHVVAKVSVTFVFGYGVNNRTSSNGAGLGVMVPYESTNDDGEELREGYTLVGWAVTDGGEIVAKAEYGVTVDGTISTYYAVWNYNYFVISFKLDANKTLTALVLKKNSSYKVENLLNGLSAEDKALLVKEDYALSWLDDQNETIDISVSITDIKDITYTAKWTITAEGLAKLKTAKLAELEAYVDEKGVELPESYSNAINNASTEAAVLEAYEAAITKVDELKAEKDAAAKALADAKTAAKAEVAAKATEGGVTAPSTEAIDNATTIEAVNAAKAAALAKIAEAAASKAKVAAVQAKINALSGKKGAELFAAIKDVDTAINALADDERVQLDMAGYTTAKNAYNTYVAAVNEDLNVASDIAMSVAAVKLASAVTAIAALAFVLKRRAL